MKRPPDIIRAPNHLGDLVMALPALAAAPDADVMVVRWLAPLVRMLPRRGDVLPFDRGTSGVLAAARTLRRRGRYRSGVLLPPSLSSALVFRMGGVRRVRGAATDRRRLLLTEAVPRERVLHRHRTETYLELVTGEPVDAAPPPVLAVPLEQVQRWAALEADLPAAGMRPTVGIVPGSNASSRRWEADRFAAVAGVLAGEGMRVLVFGSASETGLTRQVAGGESVDLGGRTDLPVLAAALAACDILVTNDSGLMHLAAAVGTRTLVISGPGDRRETAPSGSGHVYLQRLDLPCVPCVKNECPRSGAGFILPEAQRECLRLIEVQDVLTAARQMLSA